MQQCVNLQLETGQHNHEVRFLPQKQNWKRRESIKSRVTCKTGQIIATSHDLTPNGGETPYFRETLVGEILLFGQIYTAQKYDEVFPC